MFYFKCFTVDKLQVCYLEPRGKSDVTRLMKLQLGAIFSPHRAYLCSIHITFFVFKKYLRSYKMVPWLQL